MLRKFGALLKYEFLFYFRILPPLYLVLILIALAVRFQGNSRGNIFWGMNETLWRFVWMAMIVAISVITVILIIQRYIDNFFKAPGALMLTLPITVWVLVASKAIAAFCMVLLGVISVIISGGIYYMGTENWIRSYIMDLNFQGIVLTDLAVNSLVAITVLIMSFQQICLVYAVITSSYILPRFRFAAGCAMYLLIENFLVQRLFSYVSDFSANQLSNAGPFFSRLPTCLMALALAALFFWAAGMLLNRSYNLE
ncbi:MAG: hypothetical protein LBI06_07930 [Treponema sp.]|jgi:hypothetical protein|nr:hypothetical protein [Treponema sp.]